MNERVSRNNHHILGPANEWIDRAHVIHIVNSQIRNPMRGACLWDELQDAAQGEGSVVAMYVSVDPEFAPSPDTVKNRMIKKGEERIYFKELRSAARLKDLERMARGNRIALKAFLFVPQDRKL